MDHRMKTLREYHARPKWSAIGSPLRRSATSRLLSWSNLGSPRTPSLQPVSGAGDNRHAAFEADRVAHAGTMSTRRRVSFQLAIFQSPPIFS